MHRRAGTARAAPPASGHRWQDSSVSSSADSPACRARPSRPSPVHRSHPAATGDLVGAPTGFVPTAASRLVLRFAARRCANAPYLLGGRLGCVGGGCFGVYVRGAAYELVLPRTVRDR